MSIFNFKLLDKYLKGECSPEEEKIVIGWFKSSQVPPDIEKKFYDKWQQSKINPGNLEKWNRLLEDTYDKINMEELLEDLDREPNQKQQKERKDRPPVHLPAKGNSFRKIRVFLYTAILITAGVTIYYQWNGQNVEDPPLALQEIQKQTQKGQRLLTRLPDGSMVKLNSKTILRFPEKFTGGKREVYLEGEAFFDVTENKEAPFIIKTEKIDIKVLGTSFNIRSYDTETYKKVAVATGLVEVSNQAGKVLHVKPDSMAVFSTIDRELNILSYDKNKELGWKDDVLYFDKTKLNEVFEKLEEWYGVTIELMDKVDLQERFSAGFRDESLENVLQNIELTFDLHFQIKGKQVYVYKNKTSMKK